VKVGDLVRAPKWGHPEVDFELGGISYVGIIIGVYGHKAEVSGGPRGTETWDMSDLRRLADAH